MPARRALLKPMAMACCGERAPCLPSRTCSISSCTNSPAAVLGDLPSRRSSWALSTVDFSGIVSPCPSRAFLGSLPSGLPPMGFETGFRRRRAAWGHQLGPTAYPLDSCSALDEPQNESQSGGLQRLTRGQGVARRALVRAGRRSGSGGFQFLGSRLRSGLQPAGWKGEKANDGNAEAYRRNFLMAKGFDTMWRPWPGPTSNSCWT